MQSPPRKITIRLKKEANDIGESSFHHHLDSTPEKTVDLTASEEEADESDEDSLSHEDASNQLVVYDPSANSGGEITPVPDPSDCCPPFPRFRTPNPASRVLPSVGAFTVQCANCFKWRLIPTKEKYEEIREHILEQPFVCDAAREWRPEVSCDDPPDISQDGSRLWAIDKPNIAQPPPGWQRLLRIRGEGSSKFADVYYAAPSGKRLRSMVEIHKYLSEHPEFVEQGVSLSQFSFQIPRPLQENYVRKRPARLTASCDGDSTELPRPLEPGEANPLSWVGPDDCTALQLGRPSPSTPSPAKRPTRREPSTQFQNRAALFGHPKVKIEEPHRPLSGEFDL